MEDPHDEIASLKLFNEKAFKLQQSTFLQSIIADPPGLKLSGEKKRDGSFSMSAEALGPTQDSTEAFVLTFRFFIQDNEVTSLHNMARLYERSSLPQELRDRFHSARAAINDLLDRPNLINISHNGETPTNRSVLNVFVYGGLAHANPEAYRLYKDWMSFPPAAVFFRTCFTSLLSYLLEAIVFIAKLNEEAIIFLSSPPPAQQGSDVAA